MQNTHLLDLARRYYLAFGTLSLELFAKLVKAGFIVTELEQEWDAQR